MRHRMTHESGRVSGSAADEEAAQLQESHVGTKKARTSCDVQWLMGVVRCCGSTAGEEVVRGLSCKSLNVS